MIKQKFFIFVSAVSILSFFLGLLFCLFVWALRTVSWPIPIDHWARVALPVMIVVVSVILAMLLIIVSRFSAMTRRLDQEIVRREEAERSHLKLERALQQGQKMQAIGTLAGGIAHDFNNILLAIMGYTSLVREDIAPESITHRNLGKVLEAAKRGKDLVARILTFSGQRSHQFTLLDLHHVIDESLSLLQPTLPSTIKIEKNCKVNAAPIIGDMTQLQQVILNMINNAVHAMKNVGTVSLILDNAHPDEKFLNKHPGLTQDHYFSLSIEDHGRGMGAQTLARIFEPFFTTKDVGEGTGLGLSTAHGIIQEHQGEIVVKSELNKGTIFTVLLPVYES